MQAMLHALRRALPEAQWLQDLAAAAERLPDVKAALRSSLGAALGAALGWRVGSCVTLCA